jgi:hypothetical protein
MGTGPPLFIRVTFQDHKTLLAFHEQSYLPNHCLLSNKKGHATLILRAIVILGFFITIIWLYVQHNVKQTFVVLENRARENFPEHNESMKRIWKARKVETRLGIQSPALILLTYVVPGLVALVWIFLLFFL